MRRDAPSLSGIAKLLLGTCALVSAAVCAVASTGQAAVRNATAAIFMYHHVTPALLPGPYAKALSVTPQEFERQLIWLQARGCSAVSVQRMLSDVSLGHRDCEAALTFDDGYDDVARYALPLLQKYNSGATFYITSGYVGQPGHVSRVDLQKLAQAGMEIAAHSVHHYDLTILSPATLRAEIAPSRRSLQVWSGARVASFAYPAGQVNAAVKRAVQNAGFANAVTTEPGYVSVRRDRYLLPRYRILRGQGLSLLQAVLGARRDASARTQAAYDNALHSIARRRIAGNRPQTAEAIAVALLSRRFAEPITKVHVLAIPEATVAGIVLSGTKFHAALSRRQFLADIGEMGKVAFAAAPSLSEVDIWATIPMAVPAGEPVSGDFAVPTSRTVFSTVALPRRRGPVTSLTWGTTYWDPGWLRR